MLYLHESKLIFFLKICKYSILTFISILFYFGLVNYSGNKFNYLLFSIISNFLIYFAFRRNSIFFETFFSLLLWLGFWFKFSCTILLQEGLFGEEVGSFDYSLFSFDKSLIVSQVGIISFILSGYLREFFIFNYPQKIKYNFKKVNFFIKNRIKIWILFIIIFIMINFLNYYFKIYQKGLLPIYDINFFVSGIFKWLLLFGLTSISSLLIFYEINTFKFFFISSSLIIFSETFLTSLSMLSRGMIFNALALAFGIYIFSKKINITSNLKYHFKSFFIIIALFYISVNYVNYIRANYFYVGKSTEFTKDKQSQENAKKKFNLTQLNSEIIYLAVNRWVGIDGVMAVVSKTEKLKTKLLIDSLKEKKNTKEANFYERNFNIKTIDYSNQLYKNYVKGNILPGIIGYLFYSGSLLLLFISIFILTITSSLIEYAAFKLSYNNLIFSALIGQVIAFRFIHFGYLPNQTYYLFGTIFITIFIIYLLNNFLRKYKTYD